VRRVHLPIRYSPHAKPVRVYYPVLLAVISKTYRWIQKV
jgi:hypothetical protein